MIEMLNEPRWSCPREASDRRIILGRDGELELLLMQEDAGPWELSDCVDLDAPFETVRRKTVRV